MHNLFQSTVRFNRVKNRSRQTNRQQQQQQQQQGAKPDVSIITRFKIHRKFVLGKYYISIMYCILFLPYVNYGILIWKYM